MIVWYVIIFYSKISGKNIIAEELILWLIGNASIFANYVIHQIHPSYNSLNCSQSNFPKEEISNAPCGLKPKFQCAVAENLPDVPSKCVCVPTDIP